RSMHSASSVHKVDVVPKKTMRRRSRTFREASRTGNVANVGEYVQLWEYFPTVAMLTDRNF
ncbi:MAG: hypothetical protein SGPRY_001202, partial [Prymnesium sp.]